MKPKKPGPFILGYLTLSLMFVACLVTGGLLVSTDNLLPFKYQSYQVHIGIPLLVLALVFIVASVKFLIWGKKRMATNLDIVFGHLGLNGDAFRLEGRHYSGNFHGRRLDIYCKPVKNRRYFGEVKTIKYIGHTLDIYAEGKFHTRSSIGIVREGEGVQGKIRSQMVKYLSSKFIEKFGGEILELEDERFDDFKIYALDPDWMRGFLGDGDVQESLPLLLGVEINCVRQHVHVIPAALHLTTMTHIRYLTPKNITGIVGNLLKIAAAAESLPAATITSEETDVERKTRTGS
jgi:hypothetical protein